MSDKFLNWAEHIPWWELTGLYLLIMLLAIV